ncbi:hypothetical protein GGX14DRAFT_641274 [Mycena pura]|uniref:Uncharacterized protein n=1 Tax=Mycena pura TaxID=153505 RepID=A0AAD6YQG3_9AGAR|nr:hypothetical protein GGX14DRAFT_641274 [Mycena pura]
MNADSGSFAGPDQDIFFNADGSRTGSNVEWVSCGWPTKRVSHTIPRRGTSGATRCNETTGIAIAAAKTAEKMFMRCRRRSEDTRAAQRPCLARAQSIWLICLRGTLEGRGAHLVADGAVARDDVERRHRGEVEEGVRGGIRARGASAARARLMARKGDNQAFSSRKHTIWAVAHNGPLSIPRLRICPTETPVTRWQGHNRGSHAVVTENVAGVPSAARRLLYPFLLPPDPFMKLPQIPQTTTRRPKVWIVFIDPVADVQNQPKELEAIIKAQHEVLTIFREFLTEEFYISSYQAPSRDETYGGVGHMQRLEENMGALQLLHIVAGESGAYMAVRMIDFFVKHGDAFVQKTRQFDREWGDFLVSGREFSEKNDRSKLIGTVLLICPSLPSPSGFAKLMWGFLEPLFYAHTHLNPASGRVMCVSIELPKTSQLLEINLNPDTVRVVKLSDLKHELSAIYSMPQHPVAINRPKLSDVKHEFSAN